MPLEVVGPSQSSIEQLYDSLRIPRMGRPWSALVDLVRGSSEKQIFWIHSLGGDGAGGFFYYRKLARLLAPAWGSIGVRAPHVPYRSIDEMAQAYIEEIRAHQPRGPYYLGGFCFGGVVAFEMARRLVAAGEQVPVILLIESSLPSGRGKPAKDKDGAWAECRRRLRRFLSLPALERVHRLKRKGFHWGRNLISRLQGKPPSELGAIMDLSLYPPEYVDAAEIHFEAMRRYVPGPYPGRVALFLAGSDAGRRAQKEARWREHVTGGVSVCTIPSTHETLLAEPHVHTLAAEVARRL